MHTYDKKILFSTFLDQCINNGDTSNLSHLVHKDFRLHLPDCTGVFLGVAGARDWMSSLRASFPDLNVLVEGNWLVAEDDPHHVGKSVVAERLAGYLVLRGTHAETGRYAEWQQVHLVEFHNGLMQSDFVVSNLQHLADQISGTGSPTRPIPELI